MKTVNEKTLPNGKKIVIVEYTNEDTKALSDKLAERQKWFRRETK